MNGLNVLNDMGELAAQRKTPTDLNFDVPSIGHLIGDDYGQNIAIHGTEPTRNWFGEAEISNLEVGKICERQNAEDVQEENLGRAVHPLPAAFLPGTEIGVGLNFGSEAIARRKG